MSVIAEVVVNGKPLNIYNSDTSQTFINRIAALLKTHPNFIEDINIDELKDGDDIIISSLINDIQDYKYSNDPEENVMFIKDLKETYNKNDILTILKLFLSIHKNFKGIDDSKDISDAFELTEIVPLEKSLKDEDINLNIKKFLTEEKSNFMKEIKSRIIYSNEEANKLQELNKELSQIKSVIKDFKSLNIKKDNSDLKIVTNLKETNTSLSSVFSNILCTPHIPFLTFNNIFKVHKNFDMKIPEDWAISSSNFMIMKINVDGNNDNNYNNDKYTSCNIYYSNGLLTLLININYTQYSNLSEENVRDIIKKRIKESFINFQNLSFVDEKEVDISENVIIPDQTFDTYVLSDLIMNNNILCRFLAINESIQATKKKSGLYVHYFLKNSKGACNITTAEDHSVYPIKNVVKLRIKKAKDQEVANEFINLIGKVLSIYNSNQEKIIKFYKKYISNFPKEKDTEIIKDLKPSLQKLVPDLFISGYPYKCQYPPVIIPEDQVENYPEDRIMKYPIKGEGLPHYYYCNDDKKEGFEFIGLRANTLQNKNKYKYIPCCFQSDQTKRKGPYLEYFQGEVVEKGPQQNIIITNKLVRTGEYGIIPKNIDKLLTTLNNSYTYLRKGVLTTPLSFLDCILEAMDKYTSKKKTNKELFLQEEFENLTKYKNIGITSQEHPGKSVDEIRKILNKDTYMKPDRWIKLCEQYYDCKIIIFSRDKKEKDASISLPYHNLIYLYEKFNNKKLVLIYEHYGKDFDLEYPRCELIVRWNNDVSLDEGVYENFTGNFSENIYNFYTSLIDQYYYPIFDKKLNTIKGFDLKELSSLKPTHQIIDNYGKARGVVINNIILLSDPFPPINTEVLFTEGIHHYHIYKENNLEKTLEFINKNGIKIESQIIINETIKEINIRISGILFTIKVNKRSDILNIEQVKIDIIEKYPSINKDIEGVVFLKRLAFIISEYFSYYYSYYLNESNKSLSVKSIKKFIENKVKITNKEIDYILPTTPLLSKDILEENNFVSSSGYFLVENKETLKRLIYTLRIKMLNNMNNLLNYHENNQVYNFYEDIRSLSTYSDNIIVNKIDDLQKINNKIYEKIQTENDQFFIHNSLINNNKPILLKKTLNKEEAFTISSNWNKYGSISSYDDDEPIENKVLYLYKSLLDIKVNKDIKDTTKPISYALKYRKDKEDNYMALINL